MPGNCRELTEAYETLLKGDSLDANLRFWRHEAQRWQAAAAAANRKKKEKEKEEPFWYSRQHMRYKQNQ